MRNSNTGRAKARPIQIDKGKTIHFCFSHLFWIMSRRRKEMKIIFLMGITHLGGKDPRKISDGSKQDHPLLASFLQKLRDKDEPSQRAYPASIHLVRTVADMLDTQHQQHGSLNRHVIQLCITAFFWLMRPAEYLGYSSSNDDGARSSRSEAFRLEDITFTIRGTAIEQFHHELL